MSDHVVPGESWMGGDQDVRSQNKKEEQNITGLWDGNQAPLVSGPGQFSDQNHRLEEAGLPRDSLSPHRWRKEMPQEKARPRPHQTGAYRPQVSVPALGCPTLGCLIRTGSATSRTSQWPLPASVTALWLKGPERNPDPKTNCPPNHMALGWGGSTGLPQRCKEHRRPCSSPI